MHGSEDAAFPRRAVMLIFYRNFTIPLVTNPYLIPKLQIQRRDYIMTN
jgi:hypothetical protein